MEIDISVNSLGMFAFRAIRLAVCLFVAYRFVTSV